MISREQINHEWLETTTGQNKGMDKIFLEKLTWALFLLEALSQSGIKFVFKGGTAVMLLLGKPRRFSIDIDIIVPEKVDFEGIFDHIINTGLFSKYELQLRDAPSDIQKSHYKFYYFPLHKTMLNEESILLVILHEKVQYKTIQKIPVSLPFIPFEGENIYVCLAKIILRHFKFIEF
jgi:predicted nucleotidyltransferase component of viral defense system